MESVRMRVQALTFGPHALFCAQLVSNRMGVIGAALAVTMLLAVALSGSDEGSGLAIKSAKLASAKAAPSAAALKLKHMEKVALLFQPPAEMFAALD